MCSSSCHCASGPRHVSRPARFPQAPLVYWKKFVSGNSLRPERSRNLVCTKHLARVEVQLAHPRPPCSSRYHLQRLSGGGAESQRGKHAFAVLNVSFLRQTINHAPRMRWLGKAVHLPTSGLKSVSGLCCRFTAWHGEFSVRVGPCPIGDWQREYLNTRGHSQIRGVDP